MDIEDTVEAWGGLRVGKAAEEDGLLKDLSAWKQVISAYLAGLVVQHPVSAGWLIAFLLRLFYKSAVEARK